MRTMELFRTCANEHVAAAALACIGGKLEKRVATAASRLNVSSGAFVAGLVADYDRKASVKRRKMLESGMVRSDMPILVGLRHVVETALEGAWDVSMDMARGAEASLARRRGLRWRAGPHVLVRREPEWETLCT
jgi:hypothetical protein